MTFKFKGVKVLTDIIGENSAGKLMEPLKKNE